MPYDEIEGFPIWFEEHGDADGQPIVLLHGGIVTFKATFAEVLPWFTLGRRVIGIELQGHGHTVDTGRPMSIERFADDVAELIDRIAGTGPVDVWGYSLGALTATSLALRHLAKVRRLVLAASNIRPDGYHSQITAPAQNDPRLPTEEEFATWRAAYEAVAPNPDGFFPFLERMQPVVHGFAGWTADEIQSITAPTFLVIGDHDFVRLDHAAEMLDLFADARLAVLPAARHTEVMQRSDDLRCGGVQVSLASTGSDAVDNLGLATLSWVNWFNEQHRHRNRVSPAEPEARFCARQRTDPAGAGNP